MLVVEGFGAALSVENSHLKVRSGTGHRIAEGSFPRVTSPRLRRVIVITGPAGYLSIPAVRWIRDVGADLVILSPDGDVILAPSRISPDDARLRRAQALAASSDLGLEISRDLISAKIAGQYRVVVERLPDTPDRYVQGLAAQIPDAESAPNLSELRQTEAPAAVLYFEAWKRVGIRWVRRDEAKVPEHWRRFPGRGSPLARGPRMAADPVNALVNLSSALLETESVLALRAVGLDPGIGLGLHLDAKGRQSAADDLMEPVRPTAEELVLSLIGERTFSRSDFVEQGNGHVRIAPPLASSLVSAWMPELGRAVAPWAERVAAQIGKTAGVDVPTKLTQSNRSAGRDLYRRKAKRRERTRARVAERMIPKRCGICGALLENPRRTTCEECLPSVRAEAAETFAGAGRRSQAAARAAGADPSHGGNAGRKRGRAKARRKAEARAWSGSADGAFPAEILVGLAKVPLSVIAERTGLSLSYCSLIRRGLYTPHPRWWAVLQELAEETGSEDR